jgi:hypothetical protein
MGKNQMGIVATCTHRGDDQASFEEPVTVDRLRVILEGLRFLDRPEVRDRGALLVT